jgi:hypothetical protein
MSGRRVRWFGCGAASAVAIALDLRAHPGGVVAYCETGAEHPDNERFLADCERWWGVSVLRLRSDEYADTWDVWERRRFIAGPDGAPCTGILKVAPRLMFQRPDDVHVFGYTCDANDQARAKRLASTFFELEIENPLIVAGLDKSACLAMVEGASIALPVMYLLGFQNNIGDTAALSGPVRSHRGTVAASRRAADAHRGRPAVHRRDPARLADAQPHGAGLRLSLPVGVTGSGRVSHLPLAARAVAAAVVGVWLWALWALLQ